MCYVLEQIRSGFPDPAHESNVIWQSIDEYLNI